MTKDEMRQIRDAELSQAKAAVAAAQWRVDQDVRVYGADHVSRVNCERLRDAGRRLMHLATTGYSAS